MDKSPDQLSSSDPQNSVAREKRPRSESEPFVRGTPLIPQYDEEKVLKTRSVPSQAREASTTPFPLDPPRYFTEPSFPSAFPTLSGSAFIPSLDVRATCIRKAPVKTPVSAKSPSTLSSGIFSPTALRGSPLSLDGSMSNKGSPKLVSQRQKWSTLLVSTFMQSQEGYEEVKVKDVCMRIATAIPGNAEEAKDTFLTLLMNLRDSNNEPLRSRVMRGVLPVEVLVTLNEVDLVNPERRKKLDEEFEKRARDTNLTEIQKGFMTTSSLFSCPSCKARDCTWTQRQTRSGDEPMTVFCTCNVCGNTWRRN